MVNTWIVTGPEAALGAQPTVPITNRRANINMLILFRVRIVSSPS